MQWVYKIPALKDNGGLSHDLVIEMLKTKSIMSKLETQ